MPVIFKEKTNTVFSPHMYRPWRELVCATIWMVFAQDTKYIWSLIAIITLKSHNLDKRNIAADNSVSGKCILHILALLLQTFTGQSVSLREAGEMQFLYFQQLSNLVYINSFISSKTSKVRVS